MKKEVICHVGMFKAASTFVQGINMLPVIIPFYKHRDQLDKCVAHLHKQTVPVEIFVRDNNTENVYFTKAVNEGIRKYLQRDCPYILVLNQDMYLEPTAIEEMRAFMEAHPKCGIGSAVEVLKNHPQQHAAGGGLDLFPLGVRSLGPAAQYQHDEQLYWASGSCLMLRRRMIQEIGLWDESFVFIHSDGDYCLTARSRGWEVWRIGKALGQHELGTTARTDDLKIELLKCRDVVTFSKKWLSGDLYRELSYDARKCTPEFVQNTVEEARRKIPVLEGFLAAGQHRLQDLVSDASPRPPGDHQHETEPPRWRQTLSQGTKHLQAGELAQAEAALRKVLEEAPQQPLALHALGLIAYQQQNYEEAVELLALAAAVDVENALLYNTMGVVYEAMHQCNRGINAYEQAVRINPRYAEAYMNLALAYQQQGLLDHARKAGQKAIELEPDCALHLQAITPEVAGATRE